jgi:KDO2-lipid IV(A) lauroyltransferase
MTQKIPPRRKRLAAVAFMRFFAPMPLWLARGIGALLGLIAAYIPTRELEVARINIDLCFAGEDASWRRRLLRRHYIETGKAFAETCGIWMTTDDRHLRKVRRVIGEELLQVARESGEGILLLVPHLGNWEIAGNWCTSRFPVTGMYKPGKYPEVDAIMRKGREKYMGVTVPTDASGVRAMVKTLAQGGCLFILPDHEPDPAMGGEYAPLFGVQAMTGTLTSKLACGRRPVRVLALYARRLPWAQGWDVVFREADPQLRDPDLAVSLAAMNRTVEALIRECPEQYQWTYKRFKNRPPGEPPVYLR